MALSNVRLLNRERDQAAELRAANLALSRSMEVHQTLTQVALSGEGQDGIVHDNPYYVSPDTLLGGTA